jgi:hypothetical protein
MNISKKAVSEMVSYVLLVIIAVGVSVGVYNFLSVYTPKDHATCSTDVRLILQSYTCNSGNLTLNLLNKGVFKVDAVYIRFGEQSRKVKDLINSNSNQGGGLYFTTFVGNNNPGLNPGSSATKSFLLPIDPVKKYGVEIEPAVFSESNDLALCPQATITQEIACS